MADPLDEKRRSDSTSPDSTSPDSTLGELVQTLLEAPVIHQALQAAVGARDLASSAQAQAMKNLNVAPAADLDRLTRRLRGLSDRLEEVEDQLDRLSRELAALRAHPDQPREVRPPETIDQARLGEERLGLTE